MKKILILLILLLSKQIFSFTDGDLDPSFNPNSQFSPTIPGTVLTKIPPRASSITGIEIQTDGKYVVCGFAELTTATTPPTKMLVARYNTDGSLDPSFAATNQIPNLIQNNQPGVIEISIDQSSIATSLKIQKDGKIVIVGNQTPDLTKPNLVKIAVIRLLPNGDLDSSFSPLITNSSISSPHFGIVILNLTPETDTVEDLVLDQSTNSIILSGSSGTHVGTVLTSVTINAVKLTNSGDLDTSFNETGIVFVKVPNNDFNGSKVLTSDSKGNILMAGFTSKTFLINYNFLTVRLTKNGKLDPNFGNGGFAITSITLGNTDQANGLQVDSQDNIYIAGFSANLQGISKIALVKYKPNGQLDNSFGINGIVITESTNELISQGLPLIFADDLDLQHFDGKIVISGAALPRISNSLELLRLPPVSPSFIVTYPNNSKFILARYNPNDGSLDQTFNPTGANSGMPGIVATSFSSDLSFALAIQQTCPAKLIAVGTVTSPDGIFNFGLARYFAQACNANFDILTAAIQAKYGC